MISVKYIGKTEPLGFTKGQIYDVISMEHGWYRIVDPFEQADELYPPEWFEVVRK